MDGWKFRRQAPIDRFTVDCSAPISNRWSNATAGNTALRPKSIEPR
ncbi:hypothetical protein [Ancylobacter sonchi]|nr:hypothetical protein [Ancylobacter sonchi]